MELDVTLDTCNKAGSRRSKSIPNLRVLNSDGIGVGFSDFCWFFFEFSRVVFKTGWKKVGLKRS